MNKKNVIKNKKEESTDISGAVGGSLVSAALGFGIIGALVGGIIGTIVIKSLNDNKKEDKNF